MSKMLQALNITEPKADEAADLPGLDLLTINEVYQIPGVAQTGNTPLPKPFLDLSKFKPKAKQAKCRADTLGVNHQYWLRSQIEEWLDRVLPPKKTVRR